MNKQFSIYTSLLVISVLSFTSMYFLNSVENQKLVMHQNEAIQNSPVLDDKLAADSTNQAQTNNLKRSKQENYLPNVTILNYVIQKGIESLPLLRLKDFIPFFKGNQN